jgi:hypothetical protein
MRIPRVRRATAIAALLYIAAVAVFGMSIKQFHNRRTGFTGFINFGDKFYAQSLPAVRAVRVVPLFMLTKESGYDGQWYAQLAIEPLLRNRDLDTALDTPAYRARRILFAWTAYVGGLGNPKWILQAYATQNIVAWVLLAFLLLRWFPATSPRNVLPWFGCLFGAGLINSVTFALLEGPSMVVLTLGIIAVERNRSWVGAGLMGLAGLGRETNMLATGILVERVPRSREAILSLAGKLVVVALPFLLWSIYVRSVYPSFHYSNPASFTLPFQGYLTQVITTIDEIRASGWHSYARWNVLVLIGLTTQVLFLVLRREWKSPWWRMGAAYVLILPTLSPLVWEGYPGSAVRVLLPMTFAFNVLVVGSRGFWPLVILGNLSVLYGLSELKVPLLAPYL